MKHIEKKIESNNYMSINNDIKYASRSRRFFAYLVDNILLFTLIIIASVAFVSLWLEENIDQFFNHTIGTATFYTVVAVIYSLYFSIFPASKWWCTPGQRLLGVYICKTDNHAQISKLRSFSRYLILSIIVNAVSYLVSPNETLKFTYLSKSQYSSNPVYLREVSSKNKSKRSYEEYIESDVFKENNEKFTHTDKDDKNKIYHISFTTPYNKITKHNHNHKKHNHLSGSITYFATLLILLIGPTFIGHRKQTIYDMITKTCVISGKK